MKIAISGYGKMGHEVEKAALAHNHSVVVRMDQPSDWVKLEKQIRKADIVIDFSQPDMVVEIIKKCFDLQVPVVTGTTGWYDVLDEITALCHQKNGTLFYAPNFSIGVNMVFRINRKLAAMMNRMEGYKVEVKETHHIHKLDKPSGTAIKIAGDIINEINGLTKWVNHKTNDPAELPVISKRKGEIMGIHKIIYKSDGDKIVLKHKARSRSGFAFGALAAAAFVQKKQGVFTMDDLFND